MEFRIAEIFAASLARLTERSRRERGNCLISRYTAPRRWVRRWSLIYGLSARQLSGTDPHGNRPVGTRTRVSPRDRVVPPVPLEPPHASARHTARLVDRR